MFFLAANDKKVILKVVNIWIKHYSLYPFTEIRKEYKCMEGLICVNLMNICPQILIRSFIKKRFVLPKVYASVSFWTIVRTGSTYFFYNSSWLILFTIFFMNFYPIRFCELLKKVSTSYETQWGIYHMN